MIHCVRILQWFQAARYFCVERGDLVIGAWFSSQRFILLEHAPQKMPRFEWFKNCTVQFMVLALITHPTCLVAPHETGCGCEKLEVSSLRMIS